MEVGQRNQHALHGALVIERARVDELTKKVEGLNGALGLLREEVETLRKLVFLQRAGTGPSVR